MRRHLKYAMARGFHDEFQKLALIQAAAGPVATAASAVIGAVKSLGPAAVKEVATNSIVGAATKAVGSTAAPGPNPGQPSV